MTNQNGNTNHKYFKSYIDFYNKLKEPGYAVLVTGEWGVGKTYQIKKNIPQDDMYYVSLYGLTTLEELYSSVFLKMHPLKARARQVANNIGDTSVAADAFTFGISGIISSIANAVIKEDVCNDKVIVFDDLERSKIPINDILGAINKYIEHHGCKVIAIAHDKKIEESFTEAKEKIFGQTLKIEPDIRNVFDTFIEQSQAPRALEQIKSYILYIFEASDCMSLRVLRHTINDCARLLGCLDAKHIANNDAIQDLFYFFTALTISFRQGKLNISSLESRMAQMISMYSNAKEDTTNLPTIASLSKHYKKRNILISFESNILSDEILIDCIVNGYYDPIVIREHLDSTYYFSRKEDLKPWVKLIHFDESDDATVNNAISDIDIQIKNRELTDLGDIMHVFHLKLLMSCLGETNYNYEQILDDAKNYINTLLRENKLPDITDGEILKGHNYGNAHGYSYWIRDDYKHHIKRLIQHINKNMVISLRRKYPEYINEILLSMSNDINSFSKMISRDTLEIGKYSHINVLCYIKPYVFVDAWLDIPHQHWRTISSALERRYETGLLRKELSKEKNWLSKVNSTLKYRALRETGIKRHRIERLIPQV